MSTAQKRGFRLPWSSDRAPEDATETAGRLASLIESTSFGSADAKPGGDEGLGEGPFRVAPAEAQDDVSGQQAEAESEAIVLESVVDGRAGAPEVADPEGSTEPSGTMSAPSWPMSDRPEASSHQVDPEPVAANEPTPTPRRDNPLVAGLVRAMREAAEASHGESIAALRAEASVQVESLRADAANELTALGKQADDDVAAIREWAKAEVARIRAESEERIADRRAAHERALEAHAGTTDARIAEVEAAVAAYEAEMDAFFERLLAEDDPARLATLAERAPEPPALAELAAMARSVTDEPAAAAPEAIDQPEAIDLSHPTEELEAITEEPEPATDGLATSSEPETADEPLGQEAAAAAEAEAFENMELAASETADAAGEPGNVRLVVAGLRTVAGISAFKGAVGQLEGVRGVSVMAGERGTFVFTVAHDAGVDLPTELPRLPGFDARMTERDADTIHVSAREPAA